MSERVRKYLEIIGEPEKIWTREDEAPADNEEKIVGSELEHQLRMLLVEKEMKRKVYQVTERTQEDEEAKIPET